MTFIAVAAAGVLIAASATMNYIFASSMARTLLEAQVLGAVSVATDILKAALAVFIGRAIVEKRRCFALLASLVFALFTTLSLTAALGFTAANRNAVTHSQDLVNERLARAQTAIAQLKSQLMALPTTRPAGMIEELIRALQVDRRWSASRECSTSASRPQQDLCDLYFKLRAERAASAEAARLADLIADEERKADAAQHEGAGHIADAQSRYFARALGVDEAQAQRCLTALLALAVEIGAGLGVYLATAQSDQPSRSSSPPQRFPCRTHDVAAPEPLDSSCLPTHNPAQSRPDVDDGAGPTILVRTRSRRSRK